MNTQGGIWSFRYMECLRDLEDANERIARLESEKGYWLYFGVGAVFGSGVGALVMTVLCVMF